MNSRFRSSGRATLAAALVLTLIATRTTGAAPLQPGDILYTDSFAAVFSLNPATRTGATIASAGKLMRPFGVVLDANNNVFVSDTVAGAIIRIDSATGLQTVVAAGAKLGIPFGIA